MTKLLITRLNAYGLSSVLVLPILYGSQDKLFIVFVASMYSAIYLFTNYYKKNKYSLQGLLGESLITTYLSYTTGLIIYIILVSNLEDVPFFPTLLLYLLFGLPASIVIGFVLFFLNAVTIVKPHSKT